jgi:hypothetical protein
MRDKRIHVFLSTGIIGVTGNEGSSNNLDAGEQEDKQLK